MKSKLTETFKEEYGVCTNTFFEGLTKLGLSDTEMNAVPSLFLPSWGDAYESSLFKIAIVGKETAYWANENGDSLLYDINTYSGGGYDVLASCKRFRTDGPAQWQNPFWQYSASVLGKIFGTDKNTILTQDNIMLRSIAWFNGHAIETMESKGVDIGEISPEKMSAIQALADETGICDFSRFIKVFKPNVILYFYRNNGEGPLRNFPECELCKKWGENEDIHEYYIDDTIVLHMRHTTWMKKGNMAEESCANLVYEVLKQRGYITFLQKESGVTFDMYAMGTPTWRQFVGFMRNEAALHEEMDNMTLSRHLMVVMARELSKISAKMTARTLVAILNEIDRFRNDNWVYSETGRGPCSSVRGAYNAYANTVDAELIARSFTKLDGSYAYECE